MERDDQVELYAVLAARLKQAHARVRELEVPEEMRVALTRKLFVVTESAKRDVAGAARRLDRLMSDLDDGRFLDEGSP